MATNGTDTLGSRLEEARKSKGVSLREASEATKIRMEYLTLFESDDFDIPLPPIYQRGFIKIYARYLGEDADWFASEIQARLNRKQAMQTKNDVRASLGQMDLASRRRRQSSLGGDSASGGVAIEDGKEEDKQRWRVPRIKMPRLGSDPAGSEPEYNDLEESGEPLDRTFYIKVAVIVGSVTVAVVLLIALAKLILSDGDEPSLNPELAGGESATQIVGESNSAVLESRPVTIRATGGATWVRVTDVASNEILGTVSLQPGDSTTYPASGEVRVQYTQGENLEVVRGGEVFAPARPGFGRIPIE